MSQYPLHIMPCEGLVDFLSMFCSMLIKIFLDILVLILSPIFYTIYAFEQSTRTCNPCAKKRFHSIFITGASSGIGKEFALQMASSDTTLFLTGRNRQTLETIKAACERKNAEVVTFVVDITNAQQISRCILQADNQRPLDLIFANAGLICICIYYMYIRIHFCICFCVLCFVCILFFVWLFIF